MLTPHIPLSRTIENIVSKRQAEKALAQSIAAEGWAFSRFRFDMILGETADWEQFYIPKNKLGKPTFDFKGKVVLDVGSGEGESARFFRHHGASKVICFEPEDLAFKYLQFNASSKYPYLHAIHAPFKLDHLKRFDFDFLKMDIEGYEEMLLSTELERPAVIEIHGLQLRDKFVDAGWRVEYPSEGCRLGYGCVCYGYWKC